MKIRKIAEMRMKIKEKAEMRKGKHVKRGSREWEGKEKGKFVVLFLGGGGDGGWGTEKHLRFA